jgi:uncharacterized damage-inducible protein DinB
MAEMFRELFRYDDWANREAAESVARAADPPAKARRVMAHILGTQWEWLARIQGGTSKMAVWPELSPAECKRESEALLAVWAGLVSKLGPEGLKRRAEYKNSKGEPWTSTVGDIMMHVVMHGAYHRGQVATLLRDSGGEPAYTDFIHSVRTHRSGSICP